MADGTNNQTPSFADAFAAGLNGTAPAASPSQGSPAPQGNSAGEPVVPPPQPTTPAPPVIEPGAQQPKQGWWAQQWHQVGDVMKGLGAGLLRAPGMLLGQGLDAEKDTADLGGKGFSSGVMAATPLADIANYLRTQHMTMGGNYEDILSARKSLGEVGSSGVNQATANVASLALGAEGLDAMKAFAFLPKIARGAATFGTTVGLLQGQSHDGERLMNALQTLGVHNEFVDWLASDKEDGPLMDRFKNALDGTIGGVAADLVFSTAKWAWRAGHGSEEGADALEKGLRHVSEADDATSTPSPTAKAQVIAAAAKEAQTLAESLVPKDVIPKDIQTDVVSGRAQPKSALTIQDEHDAEVQHIEGQAYQAAAKNAAGTDADPSKVVMTAKAAGASADSARVVGEMDKGDYQRFLDQAAKYAGKSPEELDVTEESAPELHQGIGQIKMSTIGSPDDVAPYYRAMLDNMPAIDRPMSDEDLQKRVAQGAAALGLDRNAMSAFVQNFAGEAKRLPEAVGIARTGWQSLVEAISHNAKRGVDNLSPEELQYALDTVYSARSYGAHILDIKAGLGRGLRAWQLPAVNPQSYFQQFGDEEAFKAGSGILPEGADAAGMLPPLPRNLKELDNFYKLWNAAGDDNAARADLLQGKNIIPSPGWYMRNSVANFYTGSLLAGKAIVKGYVMPAFMGALQTAERTAGAGIAALNPMLDASTRQAMGAIAKATPLAYFQTMGDFASAFRYSIDAMRNGGQSIIGGGYSALNKNVARTGPVTQEMLDAAAKPGDLRYTLGNAINVWPRIVFTLIGGHDELTKRLSYFGRVRMQALAGGLRNGISGQDLEDYVRGAIQDAVDPVSHKATYPDVLNEAARTGFLNQPDGPSKQLVTFLNQQRNAYPELRYILPVLDVPASGLGEAIRRIPGVSYLFQQTRDDLLGHNGDIAQAEAYGRWITGATLMGTGFGLARAGLITGGGPQNPADKATWLNNGYQPYSIKVPGIGWVSYKDWEPVGSILGMMATMNDHTVHYAEDDQTHNKLLAATAALAEYGKDKAAMKGISDLLNFGDPDSSQGYFNRLIGGTASGFVPAFVHYIRNAADPDIRDAKDHWYDQLLNSIPGESTKLPPLRNILGEPIHSPNDAYNGYGLMPLTIAPATAKGNDPVIDELDKIYQLTGYAPGIIHPQELGKGHFDPRDVTLESGQPMFDRYAQLRSQPLDLLDGKNAKGLLQDLFASDEYITAKYGSPSKAEDYLGNESKLAMIRKTFENIDKAAGAQLANESPLARRYLAVGQAKADSPDLLRTHSADELVQNPAILKALKIDLNEYEDKVSGK